MVSTGKSSILNFIDKKEFEDAINYWCKLQNKKDFGLTKNTNLEIWDISG